MTELEQMYDRSATLKANIKSALVQAELLDVALNSNITKSLVSSLRHLEREYPISAQSFILGQFLLEGKEATTPVYIQIGDTTIEVVGKVIEAPQTVKKKWYQF